MSFIPAQEEYYNDIAVGKIYTRDEYDEETQAEVTKYFLETLGGQEVEIDAETYQDIVDGKYSPGGGGGGGTVVTEEKTVSLDMANGDQVVRKSQNVDGMTKVTVLKPNTLVASNIKKDVDIGGVVGDLEFSTEDKTVVLDMASGNQQIDKSDSVDGMTQVIVEKPSSLTPENIKSGVDIGGVVGSYDPQPSLMSKMITQNGIYNAQDDGVDGYSSVDVNVSGGGGDEAITQLLQGSLTSLSTNASYIMGFQAANTLETFSAPRASFIGDYAFLAYAYLRNIDVPNCWSVGSYAFQYCGQLESVYMPLCSIVYSNAFQSCSALSTVYMPTCESIGSSAFQTCGITNASFPELLRVGTSAFTGCLSLQAVSLPKLGIVRGFATCTSLSTVYLRDCTSIASGTFRNCYNLLSLYLVGSSYVSLSSPTTALDSTPISNYTMSTGGVYGSIYVPMSLLADYQAQTTANRWSAFSSRFVGLTDEQIAAL